MRMTGRRPNRSDSAPSTGENRNCISAQTVANSPTNSEARAVSPARKLSISFGKTGITMPSASMSSSTVTKTNAKAALRGEVDNSAVMHRSPNNVNADPLHPEEPSHRSRVYSRSALFNAQIGQGRLACEGVSKGKAAEVARLEPGTRPILRDGRASRGPSG